MFSLFELIEVPVPPIRILDIGARPVAGHDEIYGPLLRDKRATVIGFEPDAQACARLNRECGAGSGFLPYAIFDGQRRKFYVTNTGVTSSLYEPDHALREKFAQLSEVAEVVRVVEMDTQRLDDIPELAQGVDFIKADAQGAEYEIYRHGPRVVRSACVVHSEAHLLPVYRNQPLLADQDRILREYGFQFHRFHGFMGRPLRPLADRNDPLRPISQYTQTDVVYVKDFMRLAELGTVQLL